MATSRYGRHPKYLALTKKTSGKKWNGVCHDTRVKSRPWRAWVTADGKTIQLGCYDSAEHAVSIADYARYLLWGPDPKEWVNAKGRRCKPPNGPFVAAGRMTNSGIQKLLFRNGRASMETMAANLRACIKAAKLREE